MNFDFSQDDLCFTMPRCDDIDIEVNRQEFDCGKNEQINKHKHVVRHQHDIINEYDVVHEHDYNYYDVVTERDVVRHNDFTTHRPDYCNNRCPSRECVCVNPCAPVVPVPVQVRPSGFRRRLW